MKAKNLAGQISVKFSVVNTETGFCKLVCNDGYDEFILQACLEVRKEVQDMQEKHVQEMLGKGKHIYKKAISNSDSGFDWGLSGECNEYAVKKYGEEFCWKLFKKEARKLGVRFV